jgi:hypothetical protein
MASAHIVIPNPAIISNAAAVVEYSRVACPNSFRAIAADIAFDVTLPSPTFVSESHDGIDVRRSQRP